jgi:hypothetical protein
MSAVLGSVNNDGFGDLARSPDIEDLKGELVALLWRCNRATAEPPVKKKNPPSGQPPPGVDIRPNSMFNERQAWNSQEPQTSSAVHPNSSELVEGERDAGKVHLADNIRTDTET